MTVNTYRKLLPLPFSQLTPHTTPKWINGEGNGNYYLARTVGSRVPMELYPRKRNSLKWQPIGMRGEP